MYRSKIVAAAVFLSTTTLALPSLALSLPPSATLLPKSQWKQPPFNNQTTQVLYGQIQGVWGCLQWSQLPPRANIICGYLSVYPTPAPGPLRAGYTWICRPSVNVLIYSFPFNKGICSPVYGAPPVNTVRPKPYQIYQAIADRQILTNVAQGQLINKCVQANGVTVYKINPNSVEVKLKTFIPSPAASLTQGIPTFIYGGDNRTYSYNDTTFRSFQVAVVDPTRTLPGLISSRDYGESTQYSPLDARWATPGRPWWWWNLNQGSQPILRATEVIDNATNKVTVTKDATATRIAYYLRGKNPLNITAPPIDISLVVSIRRTSNGTIQYMVSGGHDGFPAYELYVNGARVYGYDPVANNKSPLDLFGGADEILVNTGWKNATCPS